MPSFNFNASAIEVPAARSFEPLPKGEYEMMIVKSDVKANKSGTGHYIELEMHVISGEHSGRRLWERLNVANENKQAEDIAKQALAGLCAALGIEEMNETEQLHDTPFIARIEIDRKDPTRNRVMGYSAAINAPAAKPVAAAPVRPAAAKPAARPWA